MLQRLHPADADIFPHNLLPVSPVSVSRIQETSRQTTQSIDTPQSIVTPQSMVTPQPTVIPIMTPCRDQTIAVCFSCGKVGHGVSRCSEMNETFPYMWPGWLAEKVGGRYVVISPPGCSGASPGGKRKLIRSGGSVAGISNRTRP